MWAPSSYEEHNDESSLMTAIGPRWLMDLVSGGCQSVTPWWGACYSPYFQTLFCLGGKIIKERLTNNRIFVVATNETTAPAAIAFPLFFWYLSHEIGVREPKMISCIWHFPTRKLGSEFREPKIISNYIKQLITKDMTLGLSVRD